jgi:hypothetical protein
MIMRRAATTDLLLVLAAATGLALVAVAVGGCGSNLTHPAGAAPDAGLSCLPNLDGHIDSSELRASIGTAAHYLVSTETPVSLGGSVDASGRRRWDLSAPQNGERAVTLTGIALAGAWFADTFPTAELAVPLDADATLYGVYRQDDQALWLLGIASADPSPPEGKTLLVYDTPIAALRFPLADGMAWSSSGQITGGTLRGGPYAGRDTYDLRVDGAGEVDVPEFTVTQALRVRATVTVAPAAGNPVVHKQTSFFFECFGEVARATSHDGETQDDFTTAAELRRLTL